jgi:hypothetical protein
MGCCWGKSEDPIKEPLFGNKIKGDPKQGGEPTPGAGETPNAAANTEARNAEEAKNKKKDDEDKDQTAEARQRLEEWENRRKRKLDKNKSTRRISGELEHGNWAKIVNQGEKEAIIPEHGEQGQGHR